MRCPTHPRTDRGPGLEGSQQRGNTEGPEGPERAAHKDFCLDPHGPFSRDSGWREERRRYRVQGGPSRAGTGTRAQKACAATDLPLQSWREGWAPGTRGRGTAMLGGVLGAQKSPRGYHWGARRGGVLQPLAPQQTVLSLQGQLPGPRGDSRHLLDQTRTYREGTLEEANQSPSKCWVSLSLSIWQ